MHFWGDICSAFRHLVTRKHLPKFAKLLATICQKLPHFWSNFMALYYKICITFGRRQILSHFCHIRGDQSTGVHQEREANLESVIFKVKIIWHFWLSPIQRKPLPLGLLVGKYLSNDMYISISFNFAGCRVTLLKNAACRKLFVNQILYLWFFRL